MCGGKDVFDIGLGIADNGPFRKLLGLSILRTGTGMATLNFKGKAFVQNHHLLVKYHQLVPRKEKSLTEKVSLQDNLIIHGDNLKALKALLPTYAGKIKCIYIDPPYNTGNERWVYNDNVNSPMMQDWLGKVVDKEDLTRHDKWLCMMTPRLKLLRDLLREDGVIFLTIDDNEIHHLRMLMDTVFGPDNFVAQITWQKVYSPRMDAKGYSIDHDHILAYRRSDEYRVKKVAFEQNLAQFTELDKATGQRYRRRSLRKEGKNSRRQDRPNLFYPLKAPDGTEVFPIRSDGSEGCWRWALYRYEDAKTQKLIEWVEGREGWQVYVKQYYNEDASRPPSTLWLHSQVGHNHEANEEIKTIFGETVFPNPKPVRLIKHIISLTTDPEEEDIVLDSFAGSGTTANAVLALNEEEGGNTRFILVECEDYANEITAERVRRVINGVPKAKDKNLKKGLGGSFSYFELGPPIEMESILTGDKLPTYKELARYVFYTSTGEEFVEKAVNEKKYFIGESSKYLVYLFYKPDMDYLKATALTLDRAKALGPYKNKRRLVFAPTKYLDQEHLDELRIDFAQLPFEIYQLVK